MKIKLDSQTYRNSPYTIFITMGTTGGNDASAMNAMDVYGQWGGTNLTAKAAAPQYPRTEYGAYIGKPYYYGELELNGGQAYHGIVVNEDGSITSFSDVDGASLDIPKEYITWDGNAVTVPNPYNPTTSAPLTFVISEDGSSIKCPIYDRYSGEVHEYYYIYVNLDE